MASLVIKGNRLKKSCFTHPCCAFYINQYFFVKEYGKYIFKDALHINLYAWGENKLSFSLDMHEGIEFVFTQIVVVNINITVYFSQVDSEVVWVVINQIHTEGWFLKTQFFQFHVFNGTVVERLWFLTGAENNDAEKG